MIFQETGLEGMKVIDPEPSSDSRGHFTRTWCAETFRARGIDAAFVQCGASFNHRRGTLRGLHYQAAPHEEAKLIRCTRGRVWDVALDLRVGSPTMGEWRAVELAADTGRMVYLPEGFAHGFQTLEDESELFYQISAAYIPEAARGVRWDDPELAIPWPLADPILSEKDRGLPPFAVQRGEALVTCS